jgi:peptide/nickel transport system ATP-binding protein/oligopeptide transport system ATP-binding protein
MHDAPTTPGPATRQETAPQVLLSLNNVAKHFSVRAGYFATSPLKAVDGIDMRLMRGDSVGLVGESGSGKSTVARLITGLHIPSAGEIHFEGRPLPRSTRQERLQVRSEIQMVFQDPHASLNPRRTIFQSVAEPLIIHTALRGRALRARVEELLDLVRLGRAYCYRYPHELSGGQKQRACIARAVALHPKLLILDEPTSALDVSVQAQILEFLRDLQVRLNLTCLFISHNLAVVRYLCQRVSVMYLGRIVEEGTTAEVFDRPRHPYTQVLLASVPLPQAGQAEAPLLEGDVPSPLAVPSGCPFHPRCPQALGAVCETRPPALRPHPSGSRVACHLYDEPVPRG